MQGLLVNIVTARVITIGGVRGYTHVLPIRGWRVGIAEGCEENTGEPANFPGFCEYARVTLTQLEGLLSRA